MQQEQVEIQKLEPDEGNQLGGLSQVELVLRQLDPLIKARFFEERNSGDSSDEEVDEAGWENGEVLRAAEARGRWNVEPIILGLFLICKTYLGQW